MFSYLIKVSRPRFWIYLLGPYLIGTSIAFKNDFWHLALDLNFWIWFIYFLIPANFLIYGVNDLSDQDTDKYNNKKLGYEVKFEESKFKYFIWIFIISNIPFLYFIQNNYSLIALGLFYFFGIFYSLKPIRAKSKPVIDSIFNILYIMPAIFGYLNFSTGVQVNLNIWLLIAATFWCMAMHTFSAIPDIEADKKAGLKTTAVWLNKNGSLIYCGLLFALSGIITSTVVSLYFLFFGILYLLILLYSYLNPKMIFTIYTAMPIINLLVGFGIFIFTFL